MVSEGGNPAAPAAIRRNIVLGLLAVGALGGTVGLLWTRTRPEPTDRGHDPALPIAVPPGQPTFTKDIAPILFRNCAPCHRSGEAAPFPLIEYEDVREHAEQVAKVTRIGLMPPWLPERGYGVFANERGLTAEQIGKIGQWVEEGGARGDPADLPARPQFTAGWQLGVPDLELTMEQPYEVPAEGQDVFRNFVLPVKLPATRYVRAFEFRPSDPWVVHHANILVDTTPLSRYLDERDPGPGFDGMHTGNAEPPEGHLLGWVPGKQPFGGLEGIAWRLDDGTDLLVQLHLRPDGRAAHVSFRVGLYFAREPPTRFPARLRLGSLTLDIPAGEREYAIEDRYVLPVDVEVLALLPHAHYLGKEMKAWAVRPDGSKEWLLFIKNWQFKWQDEYRYARPPFLPKGTTLFMRFTYDNSHDPRREVRWGPRTTDEMGDLWLQVLPRTREQRDVLERDFAAKEREARLAGYEQWIRHDPEDVVARIDLGDALLALGRGDQALEQYERAVAIDPGHSIARRKLGLALQAAGRLDEAMAQYRRLLEAHTDLAEVHCLLANALGSGHRPEEALSEYREALRINPNLALAHNNLGSTLAVLGRLDEAMAEFRQALRVNPDYAQAHNNLGQGLAASGQLEQAIAHFRRAVEIAPNYAQAQRNLAAALAQEERHGK